MWTNLENFADVHLSGVDCTPANSQLNNPKSKHRTVFSNRLHQIQIHKLELILHLEMQIFVYVSWLSLHHLLQFVIIMCKLLDNVCDSACSKMKMYLGGAIQMDNCFHSRRTQLLVC